MKELPESMKYVWKYFSALNRKRQGTGYGPLAITHSEILSYFTLYGISYDPIEVEIIELLDDIAMEYYNGKIQEENEKMKAKVK